MHETPQCTAWVPKPQPCQVAECQLQGSGFPLPCIQVHMSLRQLSSTLWGKKKEGHFKNTSHHCICSELNHYYLHSSFLFDLRMLRFVWICSLSRRFSINAVSLPSCCPASQYEHGLFLTERLTHGTARRYSWSIDRLTRLTGKPPIQSRLPALENLSLLWIFKWGA